MGGRNETAADDACAECEGIKGRQSITGGRKEGGSNATRGGGRTLPLGVRLPKEEEEEELGVLRCNLSPNIQCKGREREICIDTMLAWRRSSY